MDLLDLGGEQIKLVTLSACESAAVTATEHLRLLGLGPTREGGNDHAGDAAAISQPGPTESDDVDGGGALPAVAAEVVDRLDCAVLAMRYPVGDEFATGLAASFYDLLLGRGQPVGAALASSLVRSTGPDGRPVAPPSGLSLGTPALFGAPAVDLTLVPPDGTAQEVDTRTGKLADFPDQPVRFVGRVGALTRASEALAPGSRCPAVVLHGMAGAGKTACALELAYTHQQSFPLMAWFAAPEDTPGGAEIRPALVSFARALERQLPGLEWVHLVENPEQLRSFLPTLTQVFEEYRILLVLDNVESLLVDAGQWRDERWGWVLDAVTAHTGLSRVVVTSRRLPVGLPGPVLVEPVHALSVEESVLLARELPRLRGLLEGTDLPGGLTADVARDLVRRVLEVVQGHPKLLELADGAAADPAELQARLAEADRAWLARGTRLDRFLRGEAPAASGEDFWAVLAGWTRGAAAGLSSGAELLLRVVCGLEDGDRQPNVLGFVWPRVWESSEQVGPVLDLGGVMAELVARALVVEEGDPASGVVVGWRVHPGVADAVRADTASELTAVVDDAAADGWLGTLADARDRETEEQVGAWLVRAARSAAPYLLRRHHWADLNRVAEMVLVRDRSVGAAAGLAPMLQAAVEATRDSADEELALDLGRTHARAVLRLDPARGSALLEGLLAAAVTASRYDYASSVAGDLVNRYLNEGRYDQALDLADQMVDYSRWAGFGPWTQLLTVVDLAHGGVVAGEAGSGVKWPRPNGFGRGRGGQAVAVVVRVSRVGGRGCSR